MKLFGVSTKLSPHVVSYRSSIRGRCDAGPAFLRSPNFPQPPGARFHITVAAR